MIAWEPYYRLRAALPGTLRGATLLASGRRVLWCDGQAPGTSLMLSLPPTGPADYWAGDDAKPAQAERMAQLGGTPDAQAPWLTPLGARDVALAHIHQGARPGLMAVDVREARPLWRVALEPSARPPAWSDPETLLAIDPSDTVLALDMDGETRWEMQLEARLSAGVGTAGCGPARLASADGALYGCDRDHEPARLGGWRAPDGGAQALCAAMSGRTTWALVGQTLTALAHERAWDAPVEAALEAALHAPGRAMVCDPHDTVYVAHGPGEGLTRVRRDTGHVTRMLRHHTIHGLRLDHSGAVIVAASLSGDGELVALPCPSERGAPAPSGQTRMLPAAPVALGGEPHRTWVVCADGTWLDWRMVG